MTVRLRPLVLATVLALGALGCGGSSGPAFPKTAPVNGSVIHKGKPAGGYLVTFHPQSGSGSITYVPTGETDKEGKFVLRTGPNTGAAPGEYVVTITKIKVESDRKSGIETEVDELKGKYSDPAKSQWKITVKDGENALEPFKLD